VLLTAAPDLADRLPLDGVEHVRLDPAPPDVTTRESMWTETLAAFGVAAVPADVSEVARRYRLTPAQVRSAAATAARSGEVALVDLGAAARRTSTAALRAVAQPVVASYGWDDLVLPPGTLRRLRELAGAIRHRDEVFADWAFDRLAGGHTSVRALFSGPSGTGKTMAAAVVGRDVGLDVFRVDLSAVISKYVGETEKNLERVLGAAERSNAIVLFDEADALFGKRSEVKDSHDRYANIEVAFLLQRLESFDGVTILATNLAGNLDEAFARRLHVTVDFPVPDEGARLVLWQRAFPTSAPVSDDLDPGRLAAMVPLTGGEVRAASLTAAFLAANDGTAVSMSHAVRAVARLRRQQGKLPSAAEFGEYLRLVSDAEG
jgi:SpoVK/Ycf46/Vps4 family AAA+-type ATPase